MTRVRVWIPTEELKAGDIVETLGPAPNGLLDTTAGERGGRLVAIPGRDGEQAPADGAAQGPAGIGGMAVERQMASVLTEPRAFGVVEFSVRVRDRATDAYSSTPAAAQMYVNGVPRPAAAFKAAADSFAGRRRFTFAATPDF